MLGLHEAMEVLAVELKQQQTSITSSSNTPLEEPMILQHESLLLQESLQMKQEEVACLAEEVGALRDLLREREEAMSRLVSSGQKVSGMDHPHIPYHYPVSSFFDPYPVSSFFDLYGDHLLALPLLLYTHVLLTYLDRSIHRHCMNV